MFVLGLREDIARKLDTTVAAPVLPFVAITKNFLR